MQCDVCRCGCLLPQVFPVAGVLFVRLWACQPALSVAVNVFVPGSRCSSTHLSVGLCAHVCTCASLCLLVCTGLCLHLCI